MQPTPTELCVVVERDGRIETAAVSGRVVEEQS